MLCLLNPFAFLCVWAGVSPQSRSRHWRSLLVDSPEWRQYLQQLELTLGLGGVSDCFHRYILDKQGTFYFMNITVRVCDHGRLTSCEVVGIICESQSQVELLLGVLPMDFNWSLFFVHKTGEPLMQSNHSISGSHRLSDRGKRGISKIPSCTRSASGLSRVAMWTIWVCLGYPVSIPVLHLLMPLRTLMTLV